MPGRAVGCWLAEGRSERLVWAGFARQESLGWWKRKGGALVDVPASRYAERSRNTGELVWDEVPGGGVIRGFVDPNDGKPLLKVVTRECEASEAAFFGHHRICLIEDPLFSRDVVAVEAREDDLFGSSGNEGDEGG